MEVIRGIFGRRKDQEEKSTPISEPTGRPIPLAPSKDGFREREATALLENLSDEDLLVILVDDYFSKRIRVAADLERELNKRGVRHAIVAKADANEAINLWVEFSEQEIAAGNTPHRVLFALDGLLDEYALYDSGFKAAEVIEVYARNYKYQLPYYIGVSGDREPNEALGLIARERYLGGTSKGLYADYSDISDAISAMQSANTSSVAEQ